LKVIDIRKEKKKKKTQWKELGRKIVVEKVEMDEFGIWEIRVLILWIKHVSF